ncbi:sodium:proline symporter [Thalassobacillus devorans]|uniref:Sodium:proline symporter n=1 Tax=Thalassobacillus devorans TaxID=279813 RepID=A0ABQ1NG23_9BACI|nr:sodium:solute symporter family protein [Thalassobacillus devorans]NIK27248.1 sodium/pantothenate symporter [Thalassobacillus devorans]GGC76150.1 sodium:proline symporter [Thalassobacillus devorans]
MLYLIVLGFYVAFVIWASLRSLKEAESMSDFTTGGHRMGLLLGIGTTTATWVSVASVMGVPGYLYSNGVSAIIGWVAGWFLATSLIPLVAYKIRRPETPARTFPEYIHLRFEPFRKVSHLRTIVGAIMFIGYFLFVHLQVVGFGIVFSTITGIDYKYAIFAFLIFLLFTSIGGFWSVAATDALNTTLIVIGVILGGGAVLAATGGWGNIVDSISVTTSPTNIGGSEIPEGSMISPVGTFGLGALFAIFMSNAIGSIVSPHWVTRMLAPKNIKVAILQIMGSVFVLTAIFVPLIIMGLGAKTLIPSLPAGQSTDYIIPVIIQEYTPPLVGALTLVALCAAAVSSANSMLLHCATSVYYDVYLNIFPNKKINEKKFNMNLRIGMFAIAVIAVISAITPPWFLAMGFTYVYGGFGAVFFAVVILGLYWKRMNRAGAYVSMLVGLFTYIIAQVSNATNPFLIALVASLAGVLAVVFFTKKPPVEAYEPYFKADISPSTKQTIINIQKNEKDEKVIRDETEKVKKDA